MDPEFEIGCLLISVGSKISSNIDPQKLTKLSFNGLIFAQKRENALHIQRLAHRFPICDHMLFIFCIACSLRESFTIDQSYVSVNVVICKLRQFAKRIFATRTSNIQLNKLDSSAFSLTAQIPVFSTEPFTEVGCNWTSLSFRLARSTMHFSRSCTGKDVGT